MAVEGFTGKQGEGKTYNAVEHCVTDWLELRRLAARKGTLMPELWSNLPLRGARIFRNWDEFKDLLAVAAEHGLRVVVLVDELGVWMPARMWNKMDPRVLTWLQQRRRTGAGCDFYWTAPSLMHVDTMVRDITQIVWQCRRFGGSEYSHDGGAPPRLFQRRGFDPNEMNRSAEKSKVKPMKKAWRPFVRSIAALYESVAVDLSTPMERDPSSPEYYGPGDRSEPERTIGLDLTIDLERKAKR
jgi:Zonular occludens toxin (Zot)